MNNDNTSSPDPSGEQELLQWLQETKHLPECIRDFHDQKELFRFMHEVYEGNPVNHNINCIEGHEYVVDWFLWFMGSRGYTLQKTRAKKAFKPLPM
jgi:hypothetical protein